MSGHSKWKNIMHKKEKTDAQRAKVFTKIGREMSLCVKQGGPDPNVNSRLKDLIAKARANNVPMDNIERIIKKASGDGAADNYEDVTYEGYGPSGVAVIVEALTDNRNRTAGDMRHYFDKYGGNMGQTGCVGYLFTEKGVIVIEDDGKVDEEKLMEEALEAGAEDFSADEGAFEITTEPSDVGAIREALEAKGYKVVSADRDMIPSNYITLETDEDIKNMNLLLERLDENDDVQSVFHNWENCD